MKFVSPILKRAVYPALQRSGVLPHCSRKGELSVVTYHGVLPKDYQVTDPLLDGGWVTAAAFRRQVQLLRANYNVVSPEQVRQWAVGKGVLPTKAVLLTCDDGLSNATSEMLPVLQEEKIPCLFFVTVESLEDSPAMLWYEELYLTLLAAPDGPLQGRFGGVEVDAALNRSVRQRHSYWWNLVTTLSGETMDSRLVCAKEIRDHYEMSEDWLLRYVEAQASRFRLLTRGETRKLLDSGMMVGSHTISHPKLSRLPAGCAWQEIAESRSELERGLGVPVWSIAYPFGGVDSVSQREIQMAERAGYDCAFVNFGGGFQPAVPRFGIPRLHVTLDMTLAEFEANVCGLHEGLRRRFGHTEKIPASPDEDTESAHE